MQSMSNHSLLEWIDGSPYAFQNWYHPSPQTVYPSHLIEFYKRVPKRFTPGTNLTFVNLQTLQPQYTQKRLCAGVHIRPTLLPEWIMLPCDQSIAGASFVCESKINSSGSVLKKKELFSGPIWSVHGKPLI